MSDMGDSQAGPHGEPTGHLERAQPTLPAVGIQDKQARNTKLQRVNLQGASCSTQQSSGVPGLQPAEAVCPRAKDCFS